MIRVLLLMLALFVAGSPVHAAGPHLLKARIADIDAKPMAGAKLFLYDSTNVRRPADFISNLSDADGNLQIALPPGRYWGVARFKADGKYGPLLPGDKHSGEPLEIDLTGGEASIELVVADLRELGQKKHAGATDSLRLKGRVVTGDGQPVAGAFAYAVTAADFNEFPEYISAWTGEDGGYELYLPPGGKYLLGVSRQFPLKIGGIAPKLQTVEPGKIDIAIDMDLKVE